MDYRKLTEKEEKWIKSFERVMGKAPDTLFMFVGAGAVLIIPKDENNDRYMVGGGMDGTPAIHIPTKMECDGGDW